MNYTYKLTNKEHSTSDEERHTVYSYINDATKLELTLFDEPDSRYCGRFLISIKEPESDEPECLGMSSSDKFNAFLAKLMDGDHPICVGGIFFADGYESEITAETAIENHRLDELKSLGGSWADIYYSVVEADRVVRELDPDICIIQAEEDIREHEKEDAAADAAFDMMMDDFFKAKGLPADYECEDEEEFDRLSKEIEAFMQEWLKSHPEHVDF